jgi:hypothetical protein
VDGLLGDAILKVCVVYATEGKLLALFVAGLFERIIGKFPVVAMVMLNYYAILSSKGLEGTFGSDGLEEWIVDLRVNKAEAAVMVHKDCGAPVLLFGEFSLHLCIKLNLHWCHLVNGDALPRLGCHKSLMRSLGLSAAPRDLGHCAKETSSALRWLGFSQLLGDFPIEGKLFQFWKG